MNDNLKRIFDMAKQDRVFHPASLDPRVYGKDIAFIKHIRHIEPSVGEQVEMLLQRQWRILLISANNGLFGLCAVLTGQQQPMLSQSIQCGELR